MPRHSPVFETFGDEEARGVLGALWNSDLRHGGFGGWFIPRFVVGTFGDDILAGSKGRDVILGLNGDDELAGDRGNDLLFGGRGEDTASFADAAGRLRVDLASGVATTRVSAWATETDRLFSIENVIGSAYDDRIRGDNRDNRLSGGDGDDVIEGQAGDDRIEGGLGDDAIDGGRGTDTAEFAGTFGAYEITVDGAGTVTVFGPDGTDTLTKIEYLEFGDQVVDLTPDQVFTLQLFHLSDQEAGAAAVIDAPNLSAVLNALRLEDLDGDGTAGYAHTLLIGSGDAFIPGLFFDASADIYGQGGVADILIQNELGFDAISFGNHEFDLGTAVLRTLITGEGIDGFDGTAFPYLSSNLDFSGEPNLADLVVADGFAPKAGTITGSVVLTTDGGERIGLVGATTPTLGTISSPGGVTTSPQPFAGAPTPEQLDALAAEIQTSVDALLAQNADINKVVLAAHMQNIGIEFELASRLSGVDIIIAGGSNTRLLDADDALRPGDVAQGDYPTFITDADGNPVAVVNTDGSYKYLGRLVIDFDADGVIITDSYDLSVSGAYATDAAGVAAVGGEGLVDPEVQTIADLVEDVIVARDGNYFGVTNVFLNGIRGGGGLDGVRTQETNLGNLTADANLATAQSVDPTVVVSIKNGGGIRASIGDVVVPPGGTEAERLAPEGNPLTGRPDGGISQNAIQSTLAFNNGLTLLTVTTAELVAALEHGVAASSADQNNAQGRFPQISGVRFSFDPNSPGGDRIESAAIVDADGDLVAELVRDGEIVDNGGQTFRIVTLNFMADGGDGYPLAGLSNPDRVDLAQPDAATRTGLADFAPDGTEQDALAEFLASSFPEGTPFDEEDTPVELDLRIQNLAFRDDTVFDGLTSGAIVLARTLSADGDLNLIAVDNIDPQPFVSAADGFGVFQRGISASIPFALLDDSLSIFTGDTLGIVGEANAAPFFGITDSINPENAGLLSATWSFDIATDVDLGGDDLFLSIDLAAMGDFESENDIFGFDVSLDGGVTFAPLFEIVVDEAGAQLYTLEGGFSISQDDPLTVGDSNLTNSLRTFVFDLNAVSSTVDLRFTGQSDGGTEAFVFQNAIITQGEPEDTGGGGGGGDEPLALSIMQIQGADHISAYVGEKVATSGVVTAVDSNGFYMQDPTGDGDIATSDAVFVFTGSAPALAIGNSVDVVGTVSEFTPGGASTRNLSTTQIGGSPTVTVTGSGPAIDPTLIGAGGRVPPTEVIEDDDFASFDPLTDGIDFFESLEGMLVTAQDLLAVSGTNRFGEIFAVVDGGAGATGLSSRGTLNIAPDDFNPERIQIDADSSILPGFAFPQVDTGDFLGDVTGVVSYDFGNFEINPTQPFTPIDGGLTAEVSALVGTADRLSVATYNVLNLDPNDSDANPATGDPADADIADGRFAAIAAQIVDHLNAPDIIGLQEIQDNNGTVAVGDGVTAADVTMQTLIDAIAAAGGPTYAFIDNTFIGDVTSGGFPAGNIRTAFLYNPDRVDLVPGSVRSIEADDQQTNPDNPFFGGRLPLVADFVFNGETVTVVNNHLSSKGGSAPILGTEQPFEALQEDPTVNGSLDERQVQAAAVRDFVADLVAADPDAKVVVLGDMNEFEFISPVEDILGAELVNLASALPEDEIYSFVFQGNSQALDHILATGNLAAGAEIDMVHVNAEFAETSARASDHDPILVLFEIVDQSPTAIV